MSKEVNIKITPDGWECEVKLGTRTFKEVHVSTSLGSKCTEGEFETDHEIQEQLYEALSGMTFYEIMQGLKRNREFE
jgi:hypothetical protein